MRNPQHPTRERLIDVAVGLLSEKTPEEITVDEVLQLSGISKGSLYHHFVDFNDLLDVAIVQRFARYVQVDIDHISALATRVTSAEEFWAGVDAITVDTQAVENRPNRFTRVQIVARASRNAAFRQLLSAEQARLNVALADLFREGQLRGWLSKEVDAHAAAVLIQAYTLGRTIDDVTEPHVDPEKWNSLISRLVRLTLGSGELG